MEINDENAFALAIQRACLISTTFREVMSVSKTFLINQNIEKALETLRTAMPLTQKTPQL